MLARCHARSSWQTDQLVDALVRGNSDVLVPPPTLPLPAADSTLAFVYQEATKTCELLDETCLCVDMLFVEQARCEHMIPMAPSSHHICSTIHSAEVAIPLAASSVVSTVDFGLVVFFI